MASSSAHVLRRCADRDHRPVDPGPQSRARSSQDDEGGTDARFNHSEDDDAAATSRRHGRRCRRGSGGRCCARDASAADGDNLKIGQENTAANTTRLSSDDGGLHVVADTDDGAVVGESTSPDGYGIRGTSPYIGVTAVGGEIGVYTVSDYGVGVHALTYDGTALRAQTAVPQGTALLVEGVASFTRSGTVTVPAGARTARVKVTPISAATLVFATPQRRLAGTHVEAAVPDEANDSFTVHLNRRAPQDLPVAWFMLG